MSKTSRSIAIAKLIKVPKNLLSLRKEVSPYNKPAQSSRILLNSKRRVIKKEKTLTETPSNDPMACLITVERNYVKELLHSSTKYSSKSPIPSKKTSNSSPKKSHRLSHKFNTLTICDFLYQTQIKNESLKRNKSSITPDPFCKRK
jgi:hypothetical protein